MDARSAPRHGDQDAPIDELKKNLILAGYENTPLVEDPGSFAVRGGIVDVFSPLYSRPARIEFFGDAIESIRFFDPDTQRTLSETKELSICPAREVLFDDETKVAVIAAIPASRRRSSQAHREGPRADRGGRAGHSRVRSRGAAAGILSTRPRDGRLYLPKDALVVIDDPLELQRDRDTLDTDLARDFKTARDRASSRSRPRTHAISADESSSGWRRSDGSNCRSLVLGGFATSNDLDDLNIDIEDDEKPPVDAAARGRRVGTAKLAARFFI